MSGQKQKHRNKKSAPARKGIWMLPVQAGKHELSFLGGYLTKGGRFENKNFEEDYGMDQDAFYALPVKKQDKIETKVINKKIKQHYKSIRLKNKDTVWTHMGKGLPDKIIGGWSWYKVSVGEYWKRFKKEFGREIKQGYSFDGEFAEVFWETT